MRGGGRPGSGPGERVDASSTALTATQMAGALVTCSVLCLASAVWPPSAAMPVGVWYAASGVLAALAAGAHAARRRSWTPVAALVLAVLVSAVLLASCRTRAGVVTTALGLVCAGQAAGLVGGTRAVRRLLALVVAALGVGMLASPVPFAPVTWLVLTAATVVTGGMVAHLVAWLRQVATTDDLTGALTRAAFEASVARLVEACRRRSRPVSVVCLDVDDFKVVNDTRGHQAGDDVLVGLVDSWRADLGPEDVVGRMGGDEFVVVLAGRDAAAAEDWSAAALRRVPAGSPSWSHGVAQARPGEHVRTLLGRADDALYARKGRRVASS